MFCKFSPTHLPGLMLFGSPSPLRFRHFLRLLIHTTFYLKDSPHSIQPIFWLSEACLTLIHQLHQQFPGEPPWLVNRYHQMPSCHLKFACVCVSLITLWLVSVWKLREVRDSITTITNEGSSSSSHESNNRYTKHHCWMNEWRNLHFPAQSASSSALMIITSSGLLLTYATIMPFPFFDHLSQSYPTFKAWFKSYSICVAPQDNMAYVDDGLLRTPILPACYTLILRNLLSSKNLATFLNKRQLLQSLTFCRGAVNTCGSIIPGLFLEEEDGAMWVNVSSLYEWKYLTSFSSLSWGDSQLPSTLLNSLR